MKTHIYALLILVCISMVSAASDLSGVQALSVTLLNQDPDPAVAGDIVELRLAIQNTGGQQIDDLVIQVIPEYPFDVVSSQSAIQEVGSIAGYQYNDNMKIIKYKLLVNKDTTAGTYDLNIKYYSEGSSVSTQKTLSVEVQNRDSAEIIYIDKTVLVPGEETKLTFTVNNVGDAPLRHMNFYWTNEDNIILPVGSDNTRYIKYVDIGESAEIEYIVMADTNADAGLYQLDIFLSYEDPLTGDDNEITSIAGVYVGGGTDFDVAYSDSSDSETSFSIANIGSNPAFSVSVIVPQQSGWTVSGPSSSIIGNLNKGDYTMASFSLQQAGRSSDIILNIAYTDTMGARHTVEKEVALQSYATTSSARNATSMTDFRSRQFVQRESFFSKYKWFFTAAGLVLVVGGVFYLRRRHPKKR